MGTGKTTIGRVLADKLGKTLVETDSLIEKRAGKSIDRIFHEDGEVAFRALEIEVIKEAAEGDNRVIACGGGVVLNWINIDRLRQNSIIVLLTVSFDVIEKRVTADKGVRPLLNMDNKAQAIKELMEFRRPFYDRAADIQVDSSNLGIESTVDLIVDKIKEHECTNK
jgi:shikimate kinase